MDFKFERGKWLFFSNRAKTNKSFSFLDLGIFFMLALNSEEKNIFYKTSG